ncbi:MAG TPA: hypothetical protein VGX23_14290 [Actinocrinis sp.]|nr:hypothetical protein [Actinocrinis sp.]
MSAQPADAGGRRPATRLPRTLRAVRTALPDDKRAQFAAELEDGDVVAVFERWWMYASVVSSPRAMGELAKLQARDGSFVAVPAAEVFGTAWTAA